MQEDLRPKGDGMAPNYIVYFYQATLVICFFMAILYHVPHAREPNFLELSPKRKYSSSLHRRLKKIQPKVLEHGIMKNDCCPICMEKVEDSKLCVPKCLHCYHEGCISKWLEDEVHVTCPSCRIDIRLELENYEEDP